MATTPAVLELTEGRIVRDIAARTDGPENQGGEKQEMRRFAAAYWKVTV
jgi:hypothetical protein